jgi:hypothetical protein
MKYRWLAILALGLSTLASAQISGSDAAKNWLSLVDNGNYLGSWGETALIFQQQVSSQRWAEALIKVRKPLGAVLTRKEIEATSHNSLPGAPAGQYLIVRLKTDFANKPQAIETLSLQLQDGQWKVAGYFVK